MSAQLGQFDRAEDILRDIQRCDVPEGAVLAVISGAEGPSYRPVGAMMAIFPDGRRNGVLSSGCIEDDVARHAKAVAKTGLNTSLRYGLGSPYFDIQLPCGGGLDILLTPVPEADVIVAALGQLDRRKPVTLCFDHSVNRWSAMDPETKPNGLVCVNLVPRPRIVVLGKGPEAIACARLAHALQYPVALYSPDPATCAWANGQFPSAELTQMKWPTSEQPDPYTAIALFFHDHEWEPPLLATALRSPAFYCGAQGSLKARAARDEALRKLGLTEAEITACKGPIGLIRSARDPDTLALSVMSEILAQCGPVL